MAGSISEDIPPMSFGEMKDIAIVLRGSTHPNGEEVDAVCGCLEGSGHVGLRLAVLRSEVFKNLGPGSRFQGGYESGGTSPTRISGKLLSWPIGQRNLSTNFVALLSRARGTTTGARLMGLPTNGTTRK